MHLTRRMRLIWHKLWLIPLVGATADVVASEAAKLGEVTVPIPWLFSAIGVAGMLGAAVVRAYSVPLIPEGLETPDEALTRRSRVLGERLGATPVRVFVSDLPKLRGKVDTYLDGHDLFVSEPVAELPEAERDFTFARALVWRGPRGTLWSWICGFIAVFASVSVSLLAIQLWLPQSIIGRATYPILLGAGLVGYLFRLAAERILGVRLEEDDKSLGLGATGNLPRAVAALSSLADSAEEKKQVALDADALTKWWDSTGKKAVEASEWYQRERSLAAKGE